MGCYSKPVLTETVYKEEPTQRWYEIEKLEIRRN